MLDTVDLATFDYSTNRLVLDRVARSVQVTADDVPTERTAVARYGGATGFVVEADVSGDRVCLRIPPRGQPACSERPSSSSVRTVELGDLDSVLAGVADEEVFRITAERTDGAPSSVLPAPIGGSGVAGFAFPFGAEDVTHLRLFDLTGDELGEVAVE